MRKVMERRNFFAASAALVFAPASALAGEPGKTPVPLGERCKRVFRLTGDQWLEIKIPEVRKGDQIISIGLDLERGEIWALNKYTALSDWQPCRPDCKRCGKNIHRGETLMAAGWVELVSKEK